MICHIALYLYITNELLFQKIIKKWPKNTSFVLGMLQTITSCGVGSIMIDVAFSMLGLFSV